MLSNNNSLDLSSYRRRKKNTAQLLALNLKPTKQTCPSSQSRNTSSCIITEVRQHWTGFSTHLDEGLLCVGYFERQVKCSKNPNLKSNGEELLRIGGAEAAAAATARGGVALPQLGQVLKYYTCMYSYLVLCSFVCHSRVTLGDDMFYFWIYVCVHMNVKVIAQKEYVGEK